MSKETKDLIIFMLTISIFGGIVWSITYIVINLLIKLSTIAGI